MLFANVKKCFLKDEHDSVITALEFEIMFIQGCWLQGIVT